MNLCLLLLCDATAEGFLFSQFTGKEVNSMASKAEIKQAQAAYLREWRKKNPEKNKQYVENYWNKRIDRMKAEQEQQTKTAGAEPEKVSK